MCVHILYILYIYIVYIYMCVRVYERQFVRVKTKIVESRETGLRIVYNFH